MAAVVLGGVHGGVGKTVLAEALVEALRSEGCRVSSYTVGPGLDGLQYSISLPGQQIQQPVGLDGWLLTQDAACACFHSMSANAEISFIEGCLGMFDSPLADGSENGSTVQIAHWLQTPVVLIVDTQAFNTARGIVALIKGYTAVDGSPSVAGVILNKVVNESIAAEVQALLGQAAGDAIVLGAVPKVDSSDCDSSSTSTSAWATAESSIASGSLLPGFMHHHQACIDKQCMVELVTQHIDLQQLRRLAAAAAVPRPQVPLPPAACTFRVSMGVAYDEAFHQYFQQNLHMLTDAGVQLVPFSPLHDSQLPPGLSAVLVGGGPVVDWTEQLSANVPMLEALRAFSSAGGFVLGEGAGLMYLSKSLQQPGQRRYELVGLFPFHTQSRSFKCSTVKVPSYVEVTVGQQQPHALLPPGSRLRGVTTCRCQVIEERIVSGLTAALTAAADHGQASDTTNSTTTKDGNMACQPAADGTSWQASCPVTYSYSCVPAAKPQMPPVQEGYTCGTALASCVQVHYGSCPNVVQHMTQRCLRVDVASVTAAASAAAAASVATSSAAATAALSVPDSAQSSYAHSSQAAAGLTQQYHTTEGTPMGSYGSNRASSAPNLQHLMSQLPQHRHEGPQADGSFPGNLAATCQFDPPAASAGSYNAPGQYMQATLKTRKSASIPTNMYQMGSEQQQVLHMPGSGHHSRHGSFGSSAAHHQQQQESDQQQSQQQGWHPQLSLHVPKRWSLELQRLGSFTSQLIPGSKSPTGQQQHSRLAAQHTRGGGLGMGHLPEETPLSEDALQLLDGSLPVNVGRTHHTHIGVAVPLSSISSNGNSAVSLAACAPGTFSFNTQKEDADSDSQCPSIHERMSQLAASLHQEGSAAGSLRADSTAATDEESSGGCFAAAAGMGVTDLPQQLEYQGPSANTAAERFGPDLRHRLFSSQRTSLDQHNLYSAQKQQSLQAHAAGRGAGSRYSMESAYNVGYANPQQHAEHGAAMPQELSFNSMLAHHNNQQGGSGSSSNLKAAGMLSKSNSSSNLNSSPALATAGLPGSGGSIISLSPAATDCLVALGLASRLAGVTDACRVGQAASQGAAVPACQLAQLLHSMGASWAADTAAAETACSSSKSGSNSEGSSDVTNIPVVCRLVEGPDGLPRYKLDEDHIRRVQPSLVLVACEENSDDEMQLQHYQQSKMAPAVGRTPNQSFKASNLGGGGVAHGSSTLNGAIAVPGRVRLQVAVVQRVLQRAGVLWPEQRAVVLYQRCHSLAEVFEFIGVLAHAAGVPERGEQLIQGLRARLRTVACKLCYSSEGLSRDPSVGSSNSSRGLAESADGRCPTVVMLESTNQLRLGGFWVPEMLQLAGARQLAMAPAAAEPPATITWPLLKAAAPDILIIALPGLSAAEAALHVADLAVLPGFWCLPAVRSGAVYVCDHTLLLRPGPGIVLGVELLGHLAAPAKLQLPVGLAMGSVLKLSLHDGQRCRPRLVPNYMSRYC